MKLIATTQASMALFLMAAFVAATVSNAFVVVAPSRFHSSSIVNHHDVYRSGTVAAFRMPPLYFFSLGGDSSTDPERFIKEVFSMEKVSQDATQYDSLVEYIKEWSETVLTYSSSSSSAKSSSNNGITTPIIVESINEGILVRFVPKRPTGKNYKSKNEEKEEEAERKKNSNEFEKTGRHTNTALKETQEEGGLEIYVQMDDNNHNNKESLSVHAKRFNYGEDVAVKEMSEETILGKLKEALLSWKAERK